MKIETQARSFGLLVMRLSGLYKVSRNIRLLLSLRIAGLQDATKSLMTVDASLKRLQLKLDTSHSITLLAAKVTWEATGRGRAGKIDTDREGFSLQISAPHV